MNRQRSILVLIAVPAVVSLAVTLLVLTLWDRQQEPEYIMLPTHSGTALVPPRATQPPAEAAGEDSAAVEDTTADTADDDPAPADAACENPVHVVQAGEALSVIAEEYDVTVEDITEMNQLISDEFNPNFLSIDQEIVIPVCGIPTPTPTASATPTEVPTRSVPTPISTSTEPPPGTITVEVARVLNPGDITSEAVEIINRGSSVARLGSWQLVNERTEDAYTFPPLNLFPQGAVTLYTGVGEDTAIDVYWGLDEAVWEDGDTVTLLNEDGEVEDTFTVTTEE